MKLDPPHLANSIERARKELGVSKQKLYDEINQGRLKSFTVGRRRLISTESLKEYIREREAESEALIK